MIGIGPYYAPIAGNDGSWWVFDVDTCEECGQDICSANAVTLVEPEAMLRQLGMKRRPLPDEGYYSEALQMVVCMDCYE